MDANGDGKITPEEFKAPAAKLKPSIPAEQVNQRLRATLEAKQARILELEARVRELEEAAGAPCPEFLGQLTQAGELQAAADVTAMEEALPGPASAPFDRKIPAITAGKVQRRPTAMPAPPPAPPRASWWALPRRRRLYSSGSHPARITSSGTKRWWSTAPLSRER